MEPIRGLGTISRRCCAQEGRKQRLQCGLLPLPGPVLLPTPACTLSLASPWDPRLVQGRVWLAVPPTPWPLRVSPVACAADPLAGRKEEVSAVLVVGVVGAVVSDPSLCSGGQSLRGEGLPCTGEA